MSDGFSHIPQNGEQQKPKPEKNENFLVKLQISASFLVVVEKFALSTRHVDHKNALNCVPMKIAENSDGKIAKCDAKSVDLIARIQAVERTEESCLLRAAITISIQLQIAQNKHDFVIKALSYVFYHFKRIGAE